MVTGHQNNRFLLLNIFGKRKKKKGGKMNQGFNFLFFTFSLQGEVAALCASRGVTASVGHSMGDLEDGEMAVRSGAGTVN